MNKKIISIIILFLFLTILLFLDGLAIYITKIQPKPPQIVGQEFINEKGTKLAQEVGSEEYSDETAEYKKLADQFEDYRKSVVYNEVEQPKAQNQIYGSIAILSQDKITVKELLNLQCFYIFDYIWDSNNDQSYEEIDKEYNPENLPWCSDPSGGSLYRETGKQITFDINPKTTFLLWQDAFKDKTKSMKSDFFGSVNVPSDESYFGELVLVTFDKSKTATRIEVVYTD